MVRRVFCLMIAAAALAGDLAVARSDDAGSPDAASGTGRSAVDQFVSVPFEPQSVYLLLEKRLGSLEEYPARYLRRETFTKSGAAPGELYIGAQVPYAGASREPEDVRYTFFMRGAEMSFAATPIRTWTQEAFTSNMATTDALREECVRTEHEIAQRRAESAVFEGELKGLRDQASKIAGIDEIIDLKMELARLKGFGDQKAAEKERLKALLAEGRGQQAEDPKIDVLRQELSANLRDTARMTAMADRLKSRRREAARTTVEKKLSLVREMSRYNPETLAQEVLKLRAKRKDLEAKLNIAPASPSDF